MTLSSQLLTLQLAGKEDSVVSFTESIKRTNHIQGLPYFDPSRLINGSQSIEILKPLPLVSGPGWLLKKRLISVRENSTFVAPEHTTNGSSSLAESGVILESEFTLVDPFGTPYTRLTVRHSLPLSSPTDVPFKTSMFNLTGKITGQRYSRSVYSLPAPKPIPRDRAPDWVTTDQTTPSQALIYRLSGDYNPLHVGTHLFCLQSHLRQGLIERKIQVRMTASFYTAFRRSVSPPARWSTRSDMEDPRRYAI